MTAARRPLGSGPVPLAATDAAGTSGRLLPVERVVAAGGEGGAVTAAGADVRGGRRRLGPGPGSGQA
ncbi:hypothetical protein OOK13_45340 [Streptomyces sp. NBC_00378]|uniref:hypothetical protein n=1 Tax=Streptomyces sp. NBC_00378 TaxID=2975732 RepID=UPI0022534AA7|nr:hypothetical protein [Streptomyces sp. NBC_00378]MCX5115514.1 hypothetical protein [Streptomyces sp. NBC_00378]MCX5115524.1 hypothetical protein [Streptomyces sp. NBC_00378]